MKNLEEKLKRLVLVVDDEQINREILGNMLKQDYNVIYASDGDEAMEQMREYKDMLSLVLLDIIMPRVSGLQVIEQAKADDGIKNIPIIILTSEKSMEVASLEKGAVDFISKPYNAPEIILARIKRIIELYEDRTIIRKTERDYLTDLYTREFFLQYVAMTERYSKDSGYDAIAVNIDHFHLLNELFGRAFGDSVLKRMAEGVAAVTDSYGGIACRAEADMFYLYCPHTEDHEKIAGMISEGLAGMANNMKIRIRMGVYPDVDRELQVTRQIDRAQVACSNIKKDYTKFVAYYDHELHETELKNHRLMNEVSGALDEEQFQVLFQPKYDISGQSPKLTSAEALVRWQHPKYGVINPGYFISLFEENGLIQNLDHFVWKKVGAHLGAWKARLGKKISVSVNVSRMDLYDPQLSETLQTILDDNGLSAADMLLEVTESAYAEDSQQIIDMVGQLREKGFRIEMDDFGSGYSSLNMLTMLPIDYLKLDMKFIRNMGAGPREFKLVKMVKDIADHMEVPTIAEGVETEEQYQMLKSMGCSIIQGYYFSKPVTAEKFEELIKKEYK